MATPIGHSLLGMAVAQFPTAHTTEHRWRLYAFGIVAANAPDLDLAVGYIAGDVNQYHQGPSHSIAAALLFGMLGVLFSNWLGLRRVAAYVFAVVGYSSHLLLDFFCSDGRPPFGQPLLWPIADSHWIASHTFFSGIQHGGPGDGFAVVVEQIFSVVNLRAIGSELLLVTLVAAAWGFQTLRHRLDQKT